MTTEVSQGKSLIITIIAIILGFSLLSMITSFLRSGISITPIIRLVLNIALMFALFQGKHWARWIVGILAVIAGVITLLGGAAAIKIAAQIETAGIFAAVLIMLMGIAYLVSATLLFTSPAIKAYFEFREYGSQINPI